MRKMNGDESPVWISGGKMVVLDRINYPEVCEMDVIDRIEQPSILLMVGVSMRGDYLEDSLFPVSYLGFRK